MNQAALLVSDKTSSIHDGCSYFVISKPTSEEEIKELKKHNTILGEYSSDDDAISAGKTAQFNGFKEYTTYLNENGMYYPKGGLGRMVLCNITDDLTSEPGIYALDLYEFNILCGYYSSFRLANSEEMSELTVDNLKVSTIKVRNDKITELNAAFQNKNCFIYVKFFSENITDNLIKQHIASEETAQLKMLQSTNELLNGDEAAKTQKLKETFPGASQAELDKMIEMMQYLKQEVEDKNKSKDEKCASFYNKFFSTEDDINLPD